MAELRPSYVRATRGLRYRRGHRTRRRRPAVRRRRTGPADHRVGGAARGRHRRPDPGRRRRLRRRAAPPRPGGAGLGRAAPGRLFPADLLHQHDHALADGGLDRSQNPMASRSSRTVPRSGWGSALRMSRRLMALGCPYATWARALSSGRQCSSTRRSAVLRSGTTFCAPTIQIARAAPPAYPGNWLPLAEAITREPVSVTAATLPTATSGLASRRRMSSAWVARSMARTRGRTAWYRPLELMSSSMPDRRRVS